MRCARGAMRDRGVVDLMASAANLRFGADTAFSADHVHSMKAPLPVGQAVAGPGPAGAIVVANVAI